MSSSVLAKAKIAPLGTFRIEGSGSEQSTIRNRRIVSTLPTVGVFVGATVLALGAAFGGALLPMYYGGMGHTVSWISQGLGMGGIGVSLVGGLWLMQKVSDRQSQKSYPIRLIQEMRTKEDADKIDNWKTIYKILNYKKISGTTDDQLSERELCIIDYYRARVREFSEILCTHERELANEKLRELEMLLEMITESATGAYHSPTTLSGLGKLNQMIESKRKAENDR